MAQWKSFANVAGAPKWGASILQQGSGATAKAANNVTLVVNVTPGAWKAHGAVLNEVDGIFPVTPLNKANTSGESAKVHGLGWALRIAGEGPITTVTAANGNFVNGETSTISGGSANAIVTLTTNATGNLASGVVTTPGLFPNTSSAVNAFNRELHVANVNFTNSTTLTGVGNANVLTLVIGNTNIGYGVSARAVVVSNSTGGLTNTNTQAITWSGNTAPVTNATGYWGLFGNTQTNTAITATLTNANGTVITGTFVVTANLTPSTGGNVQVTMANNLVKGRAGRVTYEMLVIDRHMANGTSSVANTVQLPQ